MLTVAELPEFIRSANKLLTESERQDIIQYLAQRPKAGDLMEGTGGVRKLRWGRGAQGKSGYWFNHGKGNDHEHCIQKHQTRSARGD